MGCNIPYFFMSMKRALLFELETNPNKFLWSFRNRTFVVWGICHLNTGVTAIVWEGGSGPNSRERSGLNSREGDLDLTRRNGV